MSTRKIAVIVLHGIGSSNADYAEGLCEGLRTRTRAECGDGIVLHPIHWHPLLDPIEHELMIRARRGGTLRFPITREFLVNFIGDAFAYQPALRERTMYNAIHELIADKLRLLAAEVGGDAPLCIIAHSLGSVIASNYIYDLQTHPTRAIIADSVIEKMHPMPTPLEKGETLALFYTMGSPIALFTLRYTDPPYGRPIAMPPPALAAYHPGLFSEWVNFYDPDDAIGFPLRELNPEYGRSVTADRAIDVGNRLTSWNPLSHLSYWNDADLLNPIARSLAKVWLQLNERS
jgi:hypothetical protein